MGFFYVQIISYFFDIIRILGYIIYRELGANMQNTQTFLQNQAQLDIEYQEYLDSKRLMNLRPTHEYYTRVPPTARFAKNCIEYNRAPVDGYVNIRTGEQFNDTKNERPRSIKSVIPGNKRKRLLAEDLCLIGYSISIEEMNLLRIKAFVEIHHMDGDKHNNTIENLRLVTRRTHKLLHKKSDKIAA